MATLKQIAERAGVSVRTVSVILNGKAVEQKLSAKQVENVTRIAREMNYRPNALARAVRVRRTFQIGVLVRELSNPHTGQIIEAIERNLIARRFKMLLGLTSGSLEIAKAYLGDFSHGMVDGILNMDPFVTEDIIAGERVSVPYLNFLRPSPHFALKLDWKQGIELALDHLWGLGHRRIGFLSGPLDEISSTDRWNHYHEFVQTRSLKGIAEIGDWSYEAGVSRGPALLKKHCTAIIGANDLMALGVINAARAQGLEVPSQISIIGCDDSFNAAISSPPLTSVRIPTDEIVEISVRALLAEIAGEPFQESVVIETSLTMRGSTAAVSS